VSNRAPNWSRVRLHVVSGKGGTGKTTVAAALALALARGGRKVLLLEVEGRQGIAQLFDTAPLPYQETKIAVAEDGGVVYALPVDAEAALLEYLEMFYGIKRGGYALRKLGAIDFATTIAPGLRDVLLTGKVYEAVKRTTRTAAGRARRPTMRSSSTPRRPGASPASSTSTRRWPGSPRSARSGRRPTRSPACCARRDERRAHRHPARGDAGAGDVDVTELSRRRLRGWSHRHQPGARARSRRGRTGEVAAAEPARVADRCGLTSAAGSTSPATVRALLRRGARPRRAGGLENDLAADVAAQGLPTLRLPLPTGGRGRRLYVLAEPLTAQGVR
jgi:hypothetical protein